MTGYWLTLLAMTGLGFSFLIPLL